MARSLVNPSPTQSTNPIGEGIKWVAQITTVALETILPGVAGHWLDQRWGTSFLAMVGFALGLSLGLYHLLVLTRSKNRPPHSAEDEEDARP